ncbi:hypothetical protein OEB96_18155 [Paraliomyxa miuraensis]|nr:hypothetical protein [Paraliomyxa miuraensis]
MPRSSLVFVLVLLGLALSGCGDDGSSDGGSSTTGEDPASSSGVDPSTGADPSTGEPGTGSSSSGSEPTTGEPDGTDDTDSTGEEPPPGDPVTIAVGYGGMRVRSLDDGQTWQDYAQLIPNGGDDMDLLRGAAFGEGRFVAVGWRIFSSPDGATWTEHDNPTGQWYGAAAHGNGIFMAVGGGGYCARSDDGQAWEACTDATDDGGFTHVRSLLFLDGLFYTADANGVLRSTPDGEQWTVVDPSFGTPWAAIDDAGQIVPREEAAPAEFATKRLRGGSPIQRAEPGSEDFVPVFDVPDDNGVFQAYRFAFAEGWVQ